ncbi:MAG TPA: hypothetical protein VFS10_12225 [Pyrinomonadaceae bacterium]|nr:hypothetical protein [Pyrinomonadaceae bacterium]
MKGSVWKVLLVSLVLFFLSCGACLYGAEQERRAAEELAAEGFYLSHGGGGSEWAGFGVALFIASLSVTCGGAMMWWRESAVAGADIRAPILDLDRAATVSAEANETTQDAAREEVTTAQVEGAAREEEEGAAAREEGAALPAAGLSVEYVPPFEHFDERGRSPLERVLAGS